MLKKTFKQWLGANSKEKSIEKEPFPWIALDNTEQLNQFNISGPDAVAVIFKHSTRCGISSMMLRRFESNWQHKDESMQCYLLDLIQYRSVSDAVAKQFNVLHQSPQVLVLKGGKLLEHESHGDISALHPNMF
ncbi:MAG: hypothetical protein RLZZ241_2407 [Bacteroidota bacterium]|jgi:bacillithiol system protein YtxJ